MWVIRSAFCKEYHRKVRLLDCVLRPRPLLGVGRSGGGSAAPMRLGPGASLSALLLSPSDEQGNSLFGVGRAPDEEDLYSCTQLSRTMLSACASSWSDGAVQSFIDSDAGTATI